MGSKRYSGKTCAYCGSDAAPTIAEHVFGKKHFLVRHRANLPKVPSCEPCNTAKSQLEIYVMGAFPLGANHPAAREYAETHLGGRFAKNLPLRRSMAQSMKVLGGPATGRMVFTVETNKLLELMLWITKGLFMFHFGKPLHRHWVPLVRQVATHAEAEGIKTMSDLVAPDPDKVHRNLGDGTIEYWGSRSHRMPYCSGWQFNFYGVELTGDPDDPSAIYKTIMCATMRREDAPAAIDPEERADWSTAMRPSAASPGQPAPDQ